MEVVLVKWQKCGSFHNSGWYQGPKFVDAPPAKREEDTFLLCLDANLAHGLDLSFVPRIFLLEPIIDAALLEQVTSRAHRLGATGPVTVDTIHVFYKCSESFQQKMLLQSSSSSNRQKKRSSNNSKMMKKLHSSIYNNLHREESLKQIVCHHCYRQFASYELAEEHERKLCKRNPSNMVTIDPYHLSSVYKEIRPPLPMLSSSLSSSSSSSSSQFSSSSDWPNDTTMRWTSNKRNICQLFSYEEVRADWLTVLLLSTYSKALSWDNHFHVMTHRK